MGSSRLFIALNQHLAIGGRTQLTCIVLCVAPATIHVFCIQRVDILPGGPACRSVLSPWQLLGNFRYHLFAAYSTFGSSRPSRSHAFRVRYVLPRWHYRLPSFGYTVTCLRGVLVVINYGGGFVRLASESTSSAAEGLFWAMIKLVSVLSMAFINIQLLEQWAVVRFLVRLAHASSFVLL